MPRCLPFSLPTPCMTALLGRKPNSCVCAPSLPAAGLLTEIINSRLFTTVSVLLCCCAAGLFMSRSRELVMVCACTHMMRCHSSPAAHVCQHTPCPPCPPLPKPSQVRDTLGLTYDVSFELSLFDRLPSGAHGGDGPQPAAQHALLISCSCCRHGASTRARRPTLRCLAWPRPPCRLVARQRDQHARQDSGRHDGLPQRAAQRAAAAHHPGGCTQAGPGWME